MCAQSLVLRVSWIASTPRRAYYRTLCKATLHFLVPESTEGNETDMVRAITAARDTATDALETVRLRPARAQRYSLETKRLGALDRVREINAQTSELVSQR